MHRLPHTRVQPMPGKIYTFHSPKMPPWPILHLPLGSWGTVVTWVASGLKKTSLNKLCACIDTCALALSGFWSLFSCLITYVCWGSLGMVYTMDHEVVPGHCKSVDWLLNSSQDHFSVHQGKNGRVIMKVEVPKVHISRHNKCTDMVQWVLQWVRQER